MKKLALTLTVLFASALATFAQLEEGRITYKVTYDTDNEQMKAQLAMMGESSKETIFKGSWLKEVMDNGMSSSVSILNSETKEGLLLIDIPMMGAKYAVVIDEDSWNEVKGKDDEDVADVEETGKTQEIAGYETKEVIITGPEGTEVIQYVTDKIAPMQYGEKTKKVGGFPLKSEVETQQMVVITEAVDVSDEEIEDSEFSLEIPEGYEEKTMEEMKQLGMGGS